MDRVLSLPLIAALCAGTPASGAALGVGADPDVGFALASTPVIETGGVVGVEVTLSSASAGDVTIPFSVGGSAGAADATVSSSPLVIPAGQTSGLIDVTVLDDTLSEGRERVALTLGTPSVGQLGPNIAHEVVIADDEAAATVSFDAASQTAQESGGSVALSLTLSSARTEDSSVEFAFSGSALPGGVDFDALQLSPLIVPGGSTDVSFDIALVMDGLDEPDEDAVVTLLSGENCDLGPIVLHTLTIVDADDPPAVGFTSSASTMVETSGTETRVVELSAVSAFDVTVPITASGTAIQGADFTFAPTSLVIPAGQTGGSIDIAPVDDSDVEGTESFTLSIGAPTNASPGSPSAHEVILIDDDAADPLIAFSSPASSHGEGSGAVGIVLELSDYAAQAVTVELTAGGSATSGVDYALQSASVVIPVGALAGSALVTLLDDQDDEGDETISLDIGAVSGATAGGATSHALTIIDDDAPPIL
ncbi:MAG: Calx-beta domain-containing protein, partial [Planctomycetota bacterium]|nr:Calx-beta domain-containing protein [Planctomycetota bacterium]